MARSDLVSEDSEPRFGERRAKEKEGLCCVQETYGGDGGDRGGEKVRVERDLAGAGLLHAPTTLARPWRRIVGARPRPRGGLILCLARRLARRGQNRQPSARRWPAEERMGETVGLSPRPQTTGVF